MRTCEKCIYPCKGCADAEVCEDYETTFPAGELIMVFFTICALAGVVVYIAKIGG